MKNVNPTVVVFGTFDPLHSGHQDFFKQAKSLGGNLIIVVSRDDRIRHDKRREPYQSEAERVNEISKLNIAENVILGDKIGEYKTVQKYNPDIIAVGYDQQIPEVLKDKIKKCKIVTLKPHKSDVFKSTIIRNRLMQISDHGPII